ncbi:RIP metalloprotease RseP [Facklamia miroungae]|uniref:Zinc metalloprotease n=1 Tax=Facklamia miroungae TaxID=120956 RepID=A0A1G7P3H0_9LACT|nr:RIP metalloprotease RseP [Facklamia miroungae]NKZ28568.1 RIP metalloprotease RseP [Facklamia miroungae]SDF80835.1 regulator of sigma E protease [Facklamia miroungae]
MLKTLLVFLIIFSIIVIIHEYGHLFWAKRAGILVREFSLGMGPKIFAKQAKDGTTYTIRALPMGGYVRLAGLNEEAEVQPGQSMGLTFNNENQVVRINLSESIDINELPVRLDRADLVNDMVVDVYEQGKEELITYSVDKEAEIIERDGTVIRVAPLANRYESASVFNKILTNFGGPLNNFILSIIAFAIVGFLLPGIPTNSNQIGQIVENSPAAHAGLQAGDKITSVNNQSTKNWQELVDRIGNYPKETVRLEIQRNDQVIEKQVQLAENEQGNGSLGITISESTAIKDRLLFGFTATYRTFIMVMSALATLFTRGFDLNMLGGPVAMAQATSTVANKGMIDIIAFLASLSTNLGIVNLLPIPALDGGKIVLNLIELVRGKPISQEKEGLVTMVGVVLVLILMIAVTWNDIMRAFF